MPFGEGGYRFGVERRGPFYFGVERRETIFFGVERREKTRRRRSELKTHGVERRELF